MRSLLGSLAASCWVVLAGPGLDDLQARPTEADRSAVTDQDRSSTVESLEQTMAAAESAKEARDWAKAEAAYGQAMALAGTLEDAALLIRAADAKARFHQERWQYDEAIATCERLLLSSEDRWGLLFRARSCQWSLADLYERVEAWDKAESLRRARLEHLETSTRPVGSQLATAISALARLLRKIRPDDGEIETLLLRLRGLASTPEAERSALSALGSYYSDRGRHEEARDVWRENLELYDEDDKSQHSSIVSRQKRLAAELEKLGDFEGAERQLRSALAGDESHYGVNHFRVADSAYRLGRFLAGRERFTEAVPHLRRAVALNTAAVGDDHPGYGYLRRELDRVLVALGEQRESNTTRTEAEPEACDCPVDWRRIRSLAREGRKTEALALAEASLTEVESAYGEDSLPVVDALRELGRLHWGDQPLEAIAAYERMLAILEWQVDATDPRIAGTAGRLGYLYAVVKDHDRAVSYTRLEVDSLQLLDQATLQLAEALADLGRRYDQAGQPSQAIEYHQLAAEMWSALAGEGCREQIRALGALGWSYLNARRYDEAEDFLSGLIAWIEERESRDQVALNHAWNALARLYDETGRDAEARYARARAAGR